jgi:hypothetical protein
MRVIRISDNPSSPYARRVARYTSIGSYPLFYLDDKDNVLCPFCAAEEEANAKDPEHWARGIAACGINWEDPQLYCDECSRRIESAYADEGVA